MNQRTTRFIAIHQLTDIDYSLHSKSDQLWNNPNLATI